MSLSTADIVDLGSGAGPARHAPASVPATAPALTRKQALHLCRIDRRLGLASLAMHSGVQLAQLRKATGAADVLLVLLALAYGSLQCVVPTVAPRFHLRHRAAVTLALRLGFFAFPHTSRPEGIERVLDVDASPGPWGLLLDLLRIAWASRAIAVAASALLAPLPLHLHLPAQLFSLAMVRGGGGVCRSRLLTHPLTRRRAEGFHFFASSLAQLASSGPQLLLRRLQEDASGERSCEALLSCVHVFVGLVAGTAILTKTRAEVAVGSWQAGGGQPSGSGGGTVGRWAADARRKATGALEAATCLLFGRSWVPVPAGVPRPGSGTSTCTAGSELDMSMRLMVWWALISMVWTLSALLS